MPSGALAVQNLTVDLLSVRNITVPVVSEVPFQVDPGSIVGLFGESGCGKTTLALALPNLLPASRYRVLGTVQLRDFEVLSATGVAWRRYSVSWVSRPRGACTTPIRTS